MVELWAKPDVPLIDHIADVTRLGAEIAGRFNLPEPLRIKALLACALHDIGKATGSFQAYMQAVRNAEEAIRKGAPQPEQVRLQRLARKKKAAAYPHALASMPIALIAESLIGQRCGWNPRELEATAAVLTHHSPLGPNLYIGFDAPDYLLDPMRQILEEIWSLLGHYGVDVLPSTLGFWDQILPLLKESPADLLSEPLEIDGTQQTLRGILRGLDPLRFSQVKTILHLADWLASARRPNPHILFLESAPMRIRRYIRKKGWKLRKFQEKAHAVSGRAPILWLRAPTGSGKTEALLLWTGDAERIIYLLPTQATTNAMWERLCEIYGRDAVGLAHGRASYILRQKHDAEAEEDALDLRLFGSVFARPTTVATLDQYLLAHLNGRHWEERRSMARRAAMIIDEIHAYEPYTLGMLRAALEKEPPSRIAFASATLPRALQNFLPKGVEIEAERALWEQRRHRLIVLDNDSLQDYLGHAVKLAKEGRCVLIVANTVEQSQEIYQSLRDDFRWKPTYLLHARMIMRCRQRLEKLVKNPKPGSIFVATQVVEVSLDISYDALITEIAPLDALTQRMGRVNRQGKKTPAPVWVCGAWSKGAEAIYGKEILEESLALLQALPSMPSSRDLVKVVNRLYDRVITSKWEQEFKEGYNTLIEIQNTLGCYTIDLSDEEMRGRFTARRGSLSIDVIPSIFVQEAYQFHEQKKEWRIVELLVPVPVWWIRKAPEAFKFLSDLRVIQANLHYDPQLGLLSPTNEYWKTTSIINFL